jgi:hypothetical protein
MLQKGQAIFMNMTECSIFCTRVAAAGGDGYVPSWSAPADR